MAERMGRLLLSGFSYVRNRVIRVERWPRAWVVHCLWTVTYSWRVIQLRMPQLRQWWMFIALAGLAGGVMIPRDILEGLLQLGPPSWLGALAWLLGVCVFAGGMGSPFLEHNMCVWVLGVLDAGVEVMLLRDVDVEMAARFPSWRTIWVWLLSIVVVSLADGVLAALAWRKTLACFVVVGAALELVHLVWLVDWLGEDVAVVLTTFALAGLKVLRVPGIEEG